MTPQGMYQMLMEANASTACEAFDGHVLACIFAAGAGVRAIGAALGRPVEKLNVGQLGNVTPQLHLHVVGRRPDDAAWPGPVWGQGIAQPYTAPLLRAALQAAGVALAGFTTGS